MDNRCGSCGQTWTGTSAAHCGAECHLTFTSLSAFDRHRRGGKCLDPDEVGLVMKERDRWLGWGYPSDPHGTWHSDSRLQGEPPTGEIP